jgi:hypothetical protein
MGKVSSGHIREVTTLKPAPCIEREKAVAVVEPSKPMIKIFDWDNEEQVTFNEVNRLRMSAGFDCLNRHEYAQQRVAGKSRENLIRTAAKEVDTFEEINYLRNIVDLELMDRSEYIVLRTGGNSQDELLKIARDEMFEAARRR